MIEMFPLWRFVQTVTADKSPCLLIFINFQTSDDAHIVFKNTIQSNFSNIAARTFTNIMFACRYPISYMAQQPDGENKIGVDIR